MCFFDQHVFVCGDHKWGTFRQHCNKEYRTGETCGMKLVMTASRLATKCKICEKLETKHRRRAQEADRVRRWQQEGNKTASIERSREIIAQLDAEIMQLNYQRQQRSTTF